MEEVEVDDMEVDEEEEEDEIDKRPPSTDWSLDGREGSILARIFYRLPVRDVMRARFVCKSWRDWATCRHVWQDRILCHITESECGIERFMRSALIVGDRIESAKWIENVLLSSADMENILEMVARAWYHMFRPRHPNEVGDVPAYHVAHAYTPKYKRRKSDNAVAFRGGNIKFRVAVCYNPAADLPMVWITSKCGFKLAALGEGKKQFHHLTASSFADMMLNYADYIYFGN